MKFSELQQKTQPELMDMLAKTRQDVVTLRHKASEGQLKNVRSLRLAKKAVARILTAIKTVTNA